MFRSLSQVTHEEGSVSVATIKNQVKGFPSSAESLQEDPKMSHPTSHPALLVEGGSWQVMCEVLSQYECHSQRFSESE